MDAEKLQEFQHAHDCAHYNKEISEWAKGFIKWIEDENADKEQIVKSLQKLAERTEQDSAVWNAKKILAKETLI
jgi:hypothetical protein